MYEQGVVGSANAIFSLICSVVELTRLVGLARLSNLSNLLDLPTEVFLADIFSTSNSTNYERFQIWISFNSLVDKFRREKLDESTRKMLPSSVRGSSGSSINQKTLSNNRDMYKVAQGYTRDLLCQSMTVGHSTYNWQTNDIWGHSRPLVGLQKPIFRKTSKFT